MSVATTPLRSFHGDPAVKSIYLDRVRMHRAADDIVQGQYWEDGKGCAIGCTIHGSDHERYESELGLPEWLAHLEDAIFEGLPNDQARTFPERFLDAIPVGSDLTLVWNRFAPWVLTSDDLGLRRIADDRGKAAIQSVTDLHGRVLDGDPPSEEEWDAARATAWDAASAAWDAASAARYAASAAWDAASAARYAATAWDAASAARYAASAARYAAWDAAWDAAWKAIAGKLIELLAAAN